MVVNIHLFADNPPIEARFFGLRGELWPPKEQDEGFGGAGWRLRRSGKKDSEERDEGFGGTG